MIKNTQDNYETPLCHGCYAARIMNIYPDLKKKMENITGQYPDIEDFKSDIQKIKETGLRYIRFYSIGDFLDRREIGYIKAAASILPVEAFSKTLHQLHRYLLPEIGQIPNLHLSLSLNKNYSAQYTKDLWEFLRDNHLLKNMQLNYTFFADEDYEWKPYISIYHSCKKKKLDLFKKFGKFRTCCAISKTGKGIRNNKIAGSCFKCPNCRLPAANTNSKILIPKLMEETYKENQLCQ